MVLEGSLSTEGWRSGNAKLCIATDRIYSVTVYLHCDKQLVRVSDKRFKINLFGECWETACIFGKPIFLRKDKINVNILHS